MPATKRTKLTPQQTAQYQAELDNVEQMAKQGYLTFQPAMYALSKIAEKYKALEQPQPAPETLPPSPPPQLP